MLVQEELPIGNLTPIKGTSKSEVGSTFLEHLADSLGIHLLEVDAMIPYRESGARRCTYNPVRVLLVDHLSGEFAVRPFHEVPRRAIGL